LNEILAAYYRPLTWLCLYRMRENVNYFVGSVMNTYNTPVIFFPSSIYFTVRSVFTSSNYCWCSYEQQNLRRRGSNL